MNGKSVPQFRSGSHTTPNRLTEMDGRTDRRTGETLNAAYRRPHNKSSVSKNVVDFSFTVTAIQIYVPVNFYGANALYPTHPILGVMCPWPTVVSVVLSFFKFVTVTKFQHNNFAISLTDRKTSNLAELFAKVKKSTVT